MKWPKENLKQRANAIYLIGDYICQHGRPQEFSSDMRQHMWFSSFANIAFEDSNPNVIKVNGKRLVPHDPDFDLYPDGCDDSHADTAIRFLFDSLSWEELKHKADSLDKHGPYIEGEERVWYFRGMKVKSEADWKRKVLHQRSFK